MPLMNEPPAPLTAEKLNDVAWALDALTKVSRSLLEPIAAAGEQDTLHLTEVTVEVTMHGEPISPEDARTLLEWLDGDEMQNDLRAEAKRRETRSFDFPYDDIRRAVTNALFDHESPQDQTNVIVEKVRQIMVEESE